MLNTNLHSYPMLVIVPQSEQLLSFALMNVVIPVFIKSWRNIGSLMHEIEMQYLYILHSNPHFSYGA